MRRHGVVSPVPEGEVERLRRDVSHHVHRVASPERKEPLSHRRVIDVSARKGPGRENQVSNH